MKAISKEQFEWRTFRDVDIRLVQNFDILDINRDKINEIIEQVYSLIQESGGTIFDVVLTVQDGEYFEFMFIVDVEHYCDETVSTAYERSWMLEEFDKFFRVGIMFCPVESIEDIDYDIVAADYPYYVSILNS